MTRAISKLTVMLGLALALTSADAQAVELTILSDKGDEISCSKHLPGQYDTDKEGKTVVEVPRESFDDLFTVAYYRGGKWAAHVQVEVVLKNGQPLCRMVAYPKKPPGDWRLTADPLTISCTSWKQQFSDDFERTALGGDWKILQGDWRIENGWLRGEGGMVMCTREFEGAQRLEFDAKSDNPCDLSGIISAGPNGYESGYFLGFGSGENTLSKLLVAGKLAQRADRIIAPGQVHHIVCQRDGHRVTLHVDGSEVLNYRDERPLAGKGQNQVGLYMWFEGRADNVKVYTRRDVVRPGAAVQPEASQRRRSADLLGNRSFETPDPRYPTMPNEWTVRPWSRGDRAEWVHDPTRAHSGARYMRLASPTGPGIRLDALPANRALRLKPGQSYDIMLWARAEPGVERARLIVEPGRYSAMLTKDWKDYAFTYTHPDNAKPLLGLYISVHGGPIAVDDVAMTPKGHEPIRPVGPRPDMKTVPDKRAKAPFVREPHMWSLPTVEKVLPTDPVQPGCERAEIAAARNERESFQIIIETNKRLSDVTLSASDLIGQDGKSKIPGEVLTFDLVDTVYYPVIGPRTSRAGSFPGASPGLYPDPVVPWHKRDIEAGERKIALATLRVPRDAPAGEYRATITARSADGARMALPLTLEVFNFTLPDKLAFKPVFWADNFGGVAKKGGVISPGRRKLYSRHNPDGSVLALAKILGEHHGTPFYSHHDKCPYAVPWHWDPKTARATFDFTWLDRNAAIILEKYGAEYLCFGGKFRPYGRNSGAVWDWHRDLEKAWTQGGGEAAFPGHRHPLDSDEGKKMYRAYCKGIAEHLKKEGWLDRSFVYVCDETEPGKSSEIVKWCAQTAHESGLKTFAASSAWGWPVYLSEIDAFAGPGSDKHLERIKKEGNQWWGIYNRPCGVVEPLANARLIGADSFFRGASHFCAYLAYVPDIWIDVRDMRGTGPNAGYERGEFVSQMSYDHGFATWVYPFPAWELDAADGPASLYASSLRLEALREGVEDYEYLKLLREMLQAPEVARRAQYRATVLLEKMQALIRKSALGTKGYDPCFYRLDGRRYYDLRCEIGRLISRSAAH